MAAPNVCILGVCVCVCEPVCGHQLLACSSSGCMRDFGLFLLYGKVWGLPFTQSRSVIHAVARIVRVCVWLHAVVTLGRFRPAFVARCMRVLVGHYGVAYGYNEGSRCM